MHHINGVRGSCVLVTARMLSTTRAQLQLIRQIPSHTTNAIATTEKKSSQLSRCRHLVKLKKRKFSAHCYMTVEKNICGVAVGFWWSAQNHPGVVRAFFRNSICNLTGARFLPTPRSSAKLREQVPCRMLTFLFPSE